MVTVDEGSRAGNLASRGVLMCVRCGTFARQSAAEPEVAALACTICGQPMAPYNASANKVGTDPRNVFLIPFSGWF